MRCPRRDEMFVHDPPGYPDEDHWDNRGGVSCCSYCGSMSPEAFFAAIEHGEQLGATDKDYKVYVGGTRKFYFQHLDEEGRKRFINLLNAGGLRIDCGRFYVLPFFVKVQPLTG